MTGPRAKVPDDGLDPPVTFQGQYSDVADRECRRYVWNVIALMLENELTQERSNDPQMGQGQWLFGGVEREPDRVLIRKHARQALKQITRKTKRPW